MIDPDILETFAPLERLYAPQIIGLMGYGGAGKSECARRLRDVHGFATPHIKSPIVVMMTALLREMDFDEALIPRIIDGDLKRDPIPGIGLTSTEFQQRLGKEFLRDCVRSTFLSDLWCRKVDVLLAAARSVALESTRFPDEAAAIVARGGILVEVRRPGHEPVNAHASEAIPAPPDVVIENTGTVADLHRMVDDLVARHWGAGTLMA